MPNWVYNTISMLGIGSLDLYTLDEDGKKHFDFEKIIPSPKTEKEYLASGGDKYRDPRVRFILTESERPWFNWYDWNCDHWGTKWNACESCVYGDEVHFDTAGGAPEPIFEALSKKYPEVEMETSSTFEDGGDTLNRTYKNGEITFEEWVPGEPWEDEETKEAETVE